jgi:hypothetical protein
VAISLIASDREGNIRPLISSDSAAVVTALTIQPRASLKYGAAYRLTVLGGIRDLDPEPKTLDPAPYVTEFGTAEPVSFPGSDERFSSAGIAVVGDRAYLAENDFRVGFVRVFDLSTPATPTLRPTEPERRVFGRPMGIAAQIAPPSADPAAWDNRHEVAVVTGPANVSIPSNLYLFEVGDDGPQTRIRWIGAATLSNTAQTGIVRRVVLKDRYAYAITTFKGIQVVDLESAKAQFAAEGGDTSPMRIAFNSDQQGWGQESVVATIPLSKANGRPAFLSDLKVGDYVVDGFAQPLVIAVGETGMAVVNPFTGATLFHGPLQLPAEAGQPRTQISWGYAVALARIPIEDELGRLVTRNVAVVSGTGTEPGGATELLMVVDLTDVTHPQGSCLWKRRPTLRCTALAPMWARPTVFTCSTSRGRATCRWWPTSAPTAARSADGSRWPRCRGSARWCSRPDAGWRPARTPSPAGFAPLRSIGWCP